MTNRKCNTPDCDRAPRSRGLCGKCYDKARRNGTLDRDGLPPRPRRITNIDFESLTCTCATHGDGVRVRVRSRAGRKSEYFCRLCEWGSLSVRTRGKRRARVSKYGITQEEFSIRLEAQQGQCLICGCTFESAAEAMIDHDHERGHVRGLLCRLCNLGLGNFRDNPDALLTAAKYVRRYRIGS